MVNRIPERLKQMRKERKLSRYMVAKGIGKTLTTYGRWEDGEQVPNADHVILLCKFFNCTSDFLLGLIDE